MLLHGVSFQSTVAPTSLSLIVSMMPFYSGTLYEGQSC